MKVGILASSLRRRFISTQQTNDINQAIGLWNKEISLIHGTNPERPRQLDCLAECYLDKGQALESIEDLNKAVQLTERALGRVSSSRPGDPDLWMSLANRLNQRFLVSRSTIDLDRAVGAAHAAVLLTPEEHLLRPVRHEVHGTMLLNQYHSNGSVEDLESAIWAFHAGLEVASEGHPVVPGLLGCLGCCYGDMYDYTGSLDDLNKAVESLTGTAVAMSQDHPHLLGNLNLLGKMLNKRYEHTGSMADIDYSLDTLQKAMDMMPRHNRLRFDIMSNLSTSLTLRYSRTNSIGDLQSAINMMESVLQATPQGNRDYAARLGKLGALLSTRHDIHRSVDDLDRAITLLKTAIDLESNNDIGRALDMNNLAGGLFKRFNDTRSFDDLDEAITIFKDAATILPETHPERWMIFENLLRCYRKLGNDTIDDQIEVSLQGWNCQNSPPSTRIPLASVAAGLLNFKSRWGEASEILETAVSLLPSVSPRALKSSDQQNVLRKFPGLASLAAATALNAGKSPADALNLLESGRGVMAALLFETRAEIADLTSSHAGLANQFISLRNELDTPSGATSLSSVDKDIPMEMHAKQRRDLDAQFNTVIREIRSKPGFETFLIRPKAESLLAAASSGPIVILNANSWRCDAFIIDTHSIQLLPLPQFEVSGIKSEFNVDSESLENLWDVMACPVLDKLGFLEPPRGGDLPHVWWILTGSLSRLPIHAAGYHQEGSFDTVMDRVISSYSTQKTETFTVKFRGRQFILFDTPGFDDTRRGDGEILIDIAETLSASYKSKLKLSGIVYLHRIKDEKVSNGIQRNFDMFRYLCGDNFFSNVFLVTTFWDELKDNETGEKRERELLKKPDWWSEMKSKGSQIRRFSNTQQSAVDLLWEVAGLPPVVLQVQKEMVEQGLDVVNTTAGVALNHELADLRAKFEKEIESLVERQEKARLQQDEHLPKMLEEQEKKKTAFPGGTPSPRAGITDRYIRMEREKKTLSERIQTLEKQSQLEQDAAKTRMDQVMDDFNKVMAQLKDEKADASQNSAKVADLEREKYEVEAMGLKWKTEMDRLTLEVQKLQEQQKLSSASEKAYLDSRILQLQAQKTSSTSSFWASLTSLTQLGQFVLKLVEEVA
ncbi:hypothetical protein CGLO_14483 [Colletotrichum gloeosporioides Cg-14]|uniref:Uncharacterized protein n=1 Tax=Colletotrichum gloeosporioides (strain Cg-14) TaxID=1237896 RepID=T0K174_COLGC|nr:hypothetical protein CGLO_14483 [Colletotrichum gloeosporioides Cg-14]